MPTNTWGYQAATKNLENPNHKRDIAKNDASCNFFRFCMFFRQKLFGDKCKKLVSERGQVVWNMCLLSGRQVVCLYPTMGTDTGEKIPGGGGVLSQKHYPSTEFLKRAPTLQPPPPMIGRRHGHWVFWGEVTICAKWLTRISLFHVSCSKLFFKDINKQNKTRNSNKFQSLKSLVRDWKGKNTTFFSKPVGYWTQTLQTPTKILDPHLRRLLCGVSLLF